MTSRIYDPRCDQHYIMCRLYRPLARYAKLSIAHAPGMPGTFTLPPRVSDPDMRHGTYMAHVPWFMLGSLTSGFLWSRWRGKRSRHSRRMCNPHFWPAHRAGPLRCNFFGQPGSVSKFPPFLWVKLWVWWVGRGYIEISRYFPAFWINRVTLVTKIKLWYSLGY